MGREFQKKFTSIARPARTSEAVVRDVGPFVDPVKSPGVDGYKKSREDAAQWVESVNQWDGWAYNGLTASHLCQSRKSKTFMENHLQFGGRGRSFS